jgi:hypothetical protein
LERAHPPSAAGQQQASKRQEHNHQQGRVREQAGVEVKVVRRVEGREEGEEERRRGATAAASATPLGVLHGGARVANEAGPTLAASARGERWQWVARSGHDGALPAGTRVRVGGQEGTYVGFRRKLIGANVHSIRFDGIDAPQPLRLKSREWAVRQLA